MDKCLVLQDIVSLIQEKNNILICAHTQPDGDAIGSCIGLALALTTLQKQCIIYNESPYPEWLNFLNKPVPYINSFDKLPFEPDLIISLDCATIQRIGEEAKDELKGKININIDHHLDNPNYGNLNWVMPKMAATGLLVAELIKALGIPFSEEISTALYVSLCTDTGNFSFDNTDVFALEWLLFLAKTPINIPKIQEELYGNVSLNKLKFWAKLYANIILAEDGKLAYVKVPMEYYNEFGTTKEDLEGFVESLRQIKNVRVALLVREDAKNKVKLSMRSRNDDDVRLILAGFGGGGHKNAAGASLEMTMDQAVNIILPEVQKMW